MGRHWLAVLRVLLRSLKRAQKASPQLAELGQLHVAMHQTYTSAEPQNLSIITDFVDQKRGSIQSMVLVFDLQSRLNCCTADSCSKYVASVLGTWIGDSLLSQGTDGINIDRRPIFRIENDSYSRGIQPEVTMVAQPNISSDGKCLHLSIVIRKERQSGTSITSAELYTLFSMAATQASAQPLRNSLEVRMLVVYSRWVQIFTARTTRLYVTSVIQGWNEIADQMEIYQTSWFNFTDISCQQQILLFALEWIDLQSHSLTNPRAPLKEMDPSVQNSKNLKRKYDAVEERSHKRRKGGNVGDRVNEAYILT
ncbi:hypothetical protein G7Y89_g15468 [Cudoniella acicularis]|uniref:Uncharacterized protein n=1 Tax=Cudoniella acicularis TaxID=354080 RepID=A0A8H4QMI0_9HELO|nr:hypothetical protein G7Y89_g15468 [Cudoniella acicularis]